MRKRTSINPFQEMHGQPMTCIDWLAPLGATSESVVAAVEAAIGPLTDPVTRAVTGYLIISPWNEPGIPRSSDDPNIALYVSLQLSEFECLDRNCPAGHTGGTIRRAPVLSAGQEAALAALEGTEKLTTTRLLGRFLAVDPPNRRI